ALQRAPRQTRRLRDVVAAARGALTARRRRILAEGKRMPRRESARVDLRREIDRFLSSAALAETTRRSYRFDLEHFAGWLDGRGLNLEQVGVRELAEYTAELGRGRSRLAPASVARR